MAAPVCPTCGSPARLTTGAEIYPHLPELARKKIWCCPVCPDTYVGCHRTTDRPLGTLAGPELRQARIKVHRLLDPLWQGTFGRSAGITRDAVYAFLAARMDLPPAETHVAHFTLDQCKSALALLSGLNPLAILADPRTADRERPDRRCPSRTKPNS